MNKTKSRCIESLERSIVPYPRLTASWWHRLWSRRHPILPASKVEMLEGQILGLQGGLGKGGLSQSKNSIVQPQVA